MISLASEKLPHLAGLLEKDNHQLASSAPIPQSDPNTRTTPPTNTFSHQIKHSSLYPDNTLVATNSAQVSPRQQRVYRMTNKNGGVYSDLRILCNKEGSPVACKLCCPQPPHKLFLKIPSYYDSQT
jgi:hypothetical protein